MVNRKIFENARFTPKGDIEANWNKAVGFIPLDKEIIIYKKDDTHSAARIKIGDGKTVVQELPFSGTDIEAIQQLIDEKGELLIEYVDNAVAAIPQIDWNQNDETAKDYIKNKPFGEKRFEITWDGTIGDRDTITLENSPDFIAVKVSDTILIYEDLLGALVEISDGSSDIISEAMLLPKEESEQIGVYGHSEFLMLSIFDLDKCEAAMGVRPPSTGTYFVKDLYYNAHISSISKTKIIKLDEKYLPDGLATEAYVNEQIRIVATKDNILSIFN